MEKAIEKALLSTMDKAAESLEALAKGLDFVRPDKAKEARGAIKIMEGWRKDIEKEQRVDLENNIGILGQ